jgi:hypothetical protein
MSPGALGWLQGHQAPGDTQPACTPALPHLKGAPQLLELGTLRLDWRGRGR